MPTSPALLLVVAPSLQPLFAHLAANIRHGPLPPREFETIVVQSQGMRRWLTLQMADQFGCAGSLAVPFPAHFVRDIGQRLASHRTARDSGDPYSRDALAWRIDAMLEAGACDPLHPYLAGADERTRFGLATQIAARFDDYQMYRADLLQDWEAGRDTPGTPHASWQAMLWRTLCAEIGDATPHMPARLHRTIDALRSTTVSGLPSRVSVFGVTALPPLFIELLAALARHVPVTVYCASLGADSSHPLSLAFGRQSREFLGLLAMHGATVLPVPGAPRTERTLLASMQRELASTLPGDTVLALEHNDPTLRVHAANGPMRQLEIIRDQLLAALAADPTLRPHDLLLLVPDATEWAPLVDAVFGVGGDDAVRLPYHIADRPLRRSQPAADALSRLLALQGGRLARSEVFALLAHPFVHHAAGLTDADVDALDQLTQQADVRWGYDADSRAALGLPRYEQASWRAGLDRLLLGVAVGRHDDIMLGLLAVAGDTAGDPETLARLAAWVDSLAATLDEWRTPRTLAAWSASCVAAVERFFLPQEPGEQSLLVELANSIQQLTALADLAAYQGDVPFAVVRDWIESQLDDEGFGSGFLVGGMTVAALKPMRGLPFRVIAVAGLDDGIFPRRDRRAAFDLLEYEHRPGDRDLRGDDRQLFLDLLLAAQERLILTYNGRAVGDNSPRAPSVVIDELLDHLDRRTNGEARERLVVMHPLQPFSPRYFAPDRDPRLFTYSRAEARAAQASVERTRSDPPFVTAPIAAPSSSTAELEFTVRDLGDCWTNPSKYFCRASLGLALGDDAPDVADDELFSLDAMQKGGVRSRMLAAAIANDRNGERQRRRLLASGELPFGELGVSWHAQLAGDVAEVLTFLPDLPSVSVPVLVQRPGWRMRGRIDGIRGDCRYVVRAGSIRADHRIRAWIEHVAMCAARELGAIELPGMTMLIGKDGPVEHIGVVADAMVLLALLVDVMRQAQVTPLPFFAQAGVAWFDATRPKPKSGKGSKSAPRDPGTAAREAFDKESSQFSLIGGDNEDPYVQLCFRGTIPMVEQWESFERLSRLLFDRCLAAGATT